MRRINVIDMYHGNNINAVDFATLKQKGIFAIVHKASQGSHYADPLYAQRRKAAQDAGLLWGAYHFLDSSDPETQAKFFLQCSGIFEPNSEPFLLAADFENSARQPTLQQLMIFMKTVDQASPPGVQCALYSGNLIRETLKPYVGGHVDPSMFGVSMFFQQHRLWLAEYGPTANIPYPWNEPILKTSDQSASLPAPGVFLWQFTETGNVDPLRKTDGNFFDGTIDELKARWLA